MIIIPIVNLRYESNYNYFYTESVSRIIVFKINQIAYFSDFNRYVLGDEIPKNT